MFTFDWGLMKELIMRKILEGVRELGSFSILDIPNQVISRVAHVVAAAEMAGS